MREFGLSELSYIVFALQWTLLLTFFAFAGGSVFGAIIALVRIADNSVVNFLISAYVKTVQGLPLLMLMFLSYYGPALFGFELSPMLAAALALTIFASSFLGIIWESCLRAIPRSQWESGEALALSGFQTVYWIIAPQAIRLALPSTVGFLVQIIKQTSLASIIGFVEITRAGQLMSNATFEPFKAFMSVAVLYFIMCFPLTRLSRWLEARTAQKVRGALE